MFIFLLVFLCASDFIWGAQWEHHIELHQEVRSFNNDESHLTRQLLLNKNTQSLPMEAPALVRKF